MQNKLSWFYRISIFVILILLSINIVVKAVIWSSAKERPGRNERPYPVAIFKAAYPPKFKYTSELRQRNFNKVDCLLTPAFTMLFALVALRLIKTPENFFE